MSTQFNCYLLGLATVLGWYSYGETLRTISMFYSGFTKGLDSLIFSGSCLIEEPFVKIQTFSGVIITIDYIELRL